MLQLHSGGGAAGDDSSSPPQALVCVGAGSDAADGEFALVSTPGQVAAGELQYQRPAAGKGSTFVVRRIPHGGGAGLIWVLARYTLKADGSSSTECLYAQVAGGAERCPPFDGWQLTQDGTAPPPRLVRA